MPEDLLQKGNVFVLTKYDVKDSSKPAKKKSIDELAREVINGKWGNGETRRKKLKTAGYDYSAVQKRVNEILK